MPYIVINKKLSINFAGHIKLFLGEYIENDFYFI